jgi:hypothetical protein
MGSESENFKEVIGVTKGIVTAWLGARFAEKVSYFSFVK